MVRIAANGDIIPDSAAEANILRDHRGRMVDPEAEGETATMYGYRGDVTQGGMLSKMMGVMAAFFIFIFFTATVVGILSGALLISESFDDPRKAGVDAFNADVRDWNTKSAEKFSKIGSTLSVNATSMSKNTTAIIWPKLIENDEDPGELDYPEALYYSADIKTNFKGVTGTEESSGSITPGEEVSGGDLTLELSAGDGTTTSLTIPMVFMEERCHFRGQYKEKEVCVDHWYALQSVCIKVDMQGVPSRHIAGIKGESTDVGCFTGNEGMYESRQTNLWSPGIYRDYDSKGQVEVPTEVQVDVRSNTDPELTAGLLTGGVYTFGLNPDEKFSVGLQLLIVSSLVACGWCFAIHLRSTWPQANSWSDRLKYFYRRNLRTRHEAFNRWWVASTAAQPDQSAEQVQMGDGPLLETR